MIFDWFFALAWYWKLAIIWGYFILGMLFDLVQYTLDFTGEKHYKSYEPTFVLWFLWPLALAMIIVFGPFILLGKAFGVLR